MSPVMDCLPQIISVIGLIQQIVSTKMLSNKSKIASLSFVECAHGTDSVFTLFAVVVVMGHKGLDRGHAAKKHRSE
jgi:hypothetical protein